MVEGLLDNHPRWCSGNKIDITERVRHIRDMTEEDFRSFIRDEEIAETCNLIQHLNLPRPNRGMDRVMYGPYNYFCTYLSCITQVVIGAGKDDMNLVLMENILPFDLYTLNSSFDRWISESRIDFFEAFFKQGYTMEDLKGNIEESLVKSGNIDVLDFFLEKETEESGHVFHSSIVYHSCRYKNVDILQRLVSKCYSVNEPYHTWNNYMNFPIYQSFYLEYTGTDILDILIMAGADVNLTHTKGVSPLVYSYITRADRCFQRLLDVGARIKNEKDITEYFMYARVTPASLKLLINAGMDLRYQTDLGTPLEIIQRNTNSLAWPALKETIAFIRKELGE